MGREKSGTLVPALILDISFQDLTGSRIASRLSESQDFRDLAPAFAKAGTHIVGISRDSVASHDKFAAKESLPFPLLADTEERVCRLFDVIQPKTLYGRKFLGVERSTFLLDGAGRLQQEWRKVKVPGHAEAVLEAAQRL